MKKKKQRKITKCPVCGVSVNTNKLAEHLWRVHSKSIGGRPIRERAEANPLEVATGNGRILNITACEKALEKGARLMASRRFKRAINVLKTIPEEYPDIDNVYMLIGTSHIQLNRLEDACTYFDKAVKSDPDYPAHWYNLGAAYLHKGYVAKSRECANKALAMNPDEEVKEKAEGLLNGIKELLDLELANKPGIDAETYLMLEERFHRGTEFMDTEDLDGAIAEFKYVASIDKTSARAYGNLGLIYLLKGELERAEEYLKKSLDIDPAYKPASRNYRALKKIKKKMRKDPEYLEKMKAKIVRGYF
ncbi:MAG: tetratricopeptide repeat protein [Euryarchaeota archaeon]|nr:tetratricopeptide repeat protein [Euryarchaeota archaeon]